MNKSRRALGAVVGGRVLRQVVHTGVPLAGAGWHWMAPYLISTGHAQCSTAAVQHTATDSGPQRVLHLSNTNFNPAIPFLFSLPASLLHRPARPLFPATRA